MIDIVKISKKVLIRLSAMDFEKDKGYSSEQLIFPKKIQEKGAKHKNRISEQEVRLLFIEEFKKNSPELFYSIETPTIAKYNFGKSYKDIKVDNDGQSALLDMCIFERNSEVYDRILNIEFKHRNTGIKNIGKDVLKLVYEKQEGAFIHLVDNTDSGTFCNKKGTGILNKLYRSFSDFQVNWNNENKSIQLVIISLKQKTIVHRSISKTDLIRLESIFFVDGACGNIEDINRNGWKIEN